MSGEWPQASRALLAMEVKYEEDQAVASDPLTIIAFPANIDAMIGERRL